VRDVNSVLNAYSAKNPRNFSIPHTASIVVTAGFWIAVSDARIVYFAAISQANNTVL